MMQRRSFLGLAAAGVSLALDPPDLSGSTGERLAEALERARAGGKFLLALVAPSDLQAARVNGRLFGRLFTHGADEYLAAVATCEVACIPAAELEQEGFSPEDAFLMLLDPDTEVVVGELLRPRLAVDSPNAFEAATIEAAVRELIYPDEETLETRSERCVVALGASSGAGLHFFDQRFRPRLADLDRNAPSLYPSVARKIGLGKRWARLLANAAALRLYENAPPGARWVADPVIAMRPDPCPGCGMSVVPEPSRTFLDFYTR
jgi:hypothetical protein